MAIELIRVTYHDRLIYAAVDTTSGETNRVFTQFMAWIALAKSIRKAKTRGLRPASLTSREYAYRLKRWFDFICHWNEVVGDSDNITWQTAQKKHMDFFIGKLSKEPDYIEPGTRNGLRLVWEMFYDEFCPFMGYTHLMMSLSEHMEIDTRQFMNVNESLLGGIWNTKKNIRKSLSKEPENEDKTFRVLSQEDITLLLANFEDVVFSCISYFMYATGLRIGGALQVPYPDASKINPYITSPVLLVRDYGITDSFFPFKYIPKGHEQVGDYYTCDVPLYAWEDIWNIYHPLLEDRLPLWRRQMLQKTGDKSYMKRYPNTFWLSRDGCEIVASDVWEAYTDTRVKIQQQRRGFPNVVPQMLRHSYATWMVIDFVKEGNVSLDPNNESSVQFIHQYLQEQLGHRQRSTTIKYMKTALRVVKRRWIPKVRLSSGGQDGNFEHVVDFQGLMNSLKRELADPGPRNRTKPTN